MASTTSKLLIATGTNRGFGLAVVKAIATSGDGGQWHFALANRCSATATREAVAGLVDEARLSVAQLDYTAAGSASAYCAAFRQFVNEALDAAPATTELLLLSNAGSLGPLVAGEQLCEHAAEVEQAVTANVTAPTLLISTLLSALTGRPLRVDVVNVSSLCATTPFEYWSVYCAGKAHRDMLLRCLAHEAQQLPASSPTVRYLNYAPGPLDTAMQQQIRDQLPDDANIRRVFVDMHQAGRLVDPLVSAQRLLAVLAAGQFDSGSHVDYFDPLPSSASAI